MSAAAGERLEEEEEVRVDCVVVGAGWTGLALAAALRAFGVPSFVLIEAGRGVADFWEGNYDRIRLHTPWHGLPCDAGMCLYKYPMFKPKRDVVRYLADYQELHRLAPFTRLRERVTRVEQLGPGRWCVQTLLAGGQRRRYLCRYVAVCTSKLRVPYVPEIQGRDVFGGCVIHSRQYATGRVFAGRRVVVVGSGNSAAEIAADLVECGAGDVTMLVHGPRLFVPLPRLGRKAWLGRLFGRMTEEATYRDFLLHFDTEAYWAAVRQRDAAMAALSEDMSAFGIDRPSEGFGEANVKRGRIGTFDQGAIRLIRRGRIAVKRAKLERLSPARVHFDDGSELEADVLILATGFQPRLEEFLAQPERFLRGGQEGKGAGLAYLTPLTDNRCRSSVDGSLFFVGFDQAVNGGLSMGFWGWSCGFLIAQGLGHLPPDATFSLDALPERQADVRRRRARQLALRAATAAAAVVALGALWRRAARPAQLDRLVVY